METQELLNCFTYNKEHETFHVDSELHPDVYDAIQKAHDDGYGEYPPNNWIYKICYEACEAFTDYDDPQDALDWVEADCYTGQLNEWHTNFNGFDRIDSVREELGNCSGIDTERLAMYAQAQHKRYIYGCMLGLLD